MNCEIVEFYPTKFNAKTRQVQGTIHIYDIERGLDIRGIKVKMNKGQCFFMLPGGWSMEGTKKVYYPIISYIKQTDNQELITWLRKNGREYIINKMYQK